MTKVKHFLQKILKNYHINCATNATIKELSKLSNRELNDIGLSRGDIYHVARSDAESRYGAEANPNLKGFV